MTDARRKKESAEEDGGHPLLGIARDLLWVGVVVGGFALVLFLVCGTWPALVTIESESMVPHMNVGDLVVVVDEDRYGELTTWAEGNTTGYQAFGDYGDVIVYKPNGADNVHPIIHRAMAWTEGPPHAGYITKGDNNAGVDQRGIYPGLGAIEPVQKEWIVGKALFAIPLLGYPALHIVPFAAILIVIMLLYELISSRYGGGEAETKRGRR